MPKLESLGYICSRRQYASGFSHFDVVGSEATTMGEVTQNDDQNAA